MKTERKDPQSILIVIVVGVAALMISFGNLEMEKERKFLEEQPWTEITVVSRQEIQINSGFGSETEVHLFFSDGTKWCGAPSRSGGSRYDLLFVQEGQKVWYKKNYSTAFTDRIWKVY